MRKIPQGEGVELLDCDFYCTARPKMSLHRTRHSGAKIEAYPVGADGKKMVNQSYLNNSNKKKKRT